MKKFAAVILATLTLPVYAQRFMGALSDYQQTLEPTSQGSGGSVSPGSSSSSSTPRPEVQQGGQSSSSTQACEENDQTSMPLKYLTNLILQKDADLKINHDPRSASLAITSGDMIGNCSSMLEWKLKQPTIKDKKAYALEIRFKKDDSCTDAGCTYAVTKLENGVAKIMDKKDTVFKPTLEGFEACLEKSGVMVDGKVVRSAIYTKPINEKFSNLNESGSLYVVSHGLASEQIKAKYGKFDPIDRCDHYEEAHPQIKSLLTYQDAEKIRLDAEAEKLKECTINEYYKVADFLEKYESYNSQLAEVRDRLIMESAKKSAELILKGEYKDDDLKVLGDFDKYVVQPKVEYAVALYHEMIELEGDAKVAKQEELKKVLAEISALKQKPYFTAAHTQRLLKDGKFEDAEKLNTMVLMLDSHQRLGAKENNIVITPAYARTKVTQGIQAFSTYLVGEREKYEIRTGQVSGQSQTYAQLASRMRQNIQARNENFSVEIQGEYARMQQPNGYCYKYWRNAQKCIQDSMERIQELQMLLQHYNKIDTERAAEYDQKAKDYKALEDEGGRYIAAQNGTPVPETSNQPQRPTDTTAAPSRPADAQTQPGQQPGVYNFQFNGGQQQQPQQGMAQLYQTPTNPYMQQNMYMQQQNPYMMQQQYQSPYMGQQAYGYSGQFGVQGYAGAQTGFMQQGYGQNSYSFNFNGGQQQPMYQTQQYPQYGYQQNMMYGGYSPYMQYGQYNMYGGGLMR